MTKEIIEIRKKEGDRFEFKRSYRSCRSCKFYVRVNEMKKTDITSRGFSFCNQELCEFGLHISSSQSTDCDKFDLDEKNMMRTEAEDDYQKRRETFADKYVTQLKKSIRKGMSKKNKYNMMHWLFADREYRVEGIRQYDLKHMNEYIKLCNDCDINMKQYRQLLDGIREFIKRFLVVEKEKYKKNNNR